MRFLHHSGLALNTLFAKVFMNMNRVSRTEPCKISCSTMSGVKRNFPFEAQSAAAGFQRSLPLPLPEVFAGRPVTFSEGHGFSRHITYQNKYAASHFKFFLEVIR